MYSVCQTVRNCTTGEYGYVKEHWPFSCRAKYKTTMNLPCLVSKIQDDFANRGRAPFQPRFPYLVWEGCLLCHNYMYISTCSFMPSTADGKLRGKHTNRPKRAANGEKKFITAHFLPAQLPVDPAVTNPTELNAHTYQFASGASCGCREQVEGWSGW